MIMKETRKKYSGVIVPMITPLNQDLTLDAHALSRILETFSSQNVSAFIMGTTGESASLPETLRTELVEQTAKVKKDNTLLYAGISGNCLKESIDAGNRYADLGVDAVVIHLPFFYPLSDKAMILYFESVAEKVRCPVLLYNNPLTVRWSVPIEIIDKISTHPNIAGFKDSENSISRIKTACRLWTGRDDFSYLMGCAAHSSYALEKGCDGIVPSAANLVPGHYMTLYHAAVEGDAAKADEYQLHMNRIAEIYQNRKGISHAIPALKVIMSEFGLCKPYVMPPLYTLNIKEQNKLKQQIREVLNTLPVKQ